MLLSWARFTTARALASTESCVEGACGIQPQPETSCCATDGFRRELSNLRTPEVVHSGENQGQNPPKPNQGCK